MKRMSLLLSTVCSLILLAACSGGSSDSSSSASSSGWTWVGGSQYSGAFNYDFTAQGVGSTLNMPGARSTSVSWIDKEGNFWLFGGLTENAVTFLGDMWKYNPKTKEWAWMNGSQASNTYGSYGTQGLAAASNSPGARIGPVAWTDTSGNLWMYGGFGYAESGTMGTLNDLWKYNIASGLWTWISGGKGITALPVYGAKDVPSTTNTPGGIVGANGWITSDGHLWIYGGAQNSALTITYNNLWEFDPSASTWTFRSGAGKDSSSNYLTNSAGVYGAKTVSASTNQPGARLDAVSWLDSSNNLWFFGGNGWDSAGTSAAILNDLWKYDTTTKQWTWMNGSNLNNAYGVYGTKGVAAAANTPGARWYRGPFAWVDALGNFWMFGADGNGASRSGLLNDWWKYNASTNQWSWMTGATEPGALPVYGTQGTFSTSNQPGSRKDVIGWSDASGNLWMFGGYGPDAAGTTGYLNDLWKYTQ